MTNRILDKITKIGVIKDEIGEILSNILSDIFPQDIYESFKEYPGLIRSCEKYVALPELEYTPENYFHINHLTGGITSYNGSAFPEDDPIESVEGDGNFSGGYGTEESPYIVSTINDLLNVSNFQNSFFLQNRDIDLSKYYANEGRWTGICSTYSPFEGVYDGGGFAILKMRSNTSLFSVIVGNVKNVKLVDPVVNYPSSYHETFGIFVNLTSNAIIENCHVIRGMVIPPMTNTTGIGGFVGVDEDSIFTDCSVDVHIIKFNDEDLSGSDFPTGGFSSESYDSTFLRCHVKMIIDAPYGQICAGGFIGHLNGVFDIQQCSVEGSFNSKKSGKYCGGFVSLVEYTNITSIIKNCCTTLDMISEENDINQQYNAGFISSFSGHVEDVYLIENCFSSGIMTNNSGDDAFVGDVPNVNLALTINNCYYDNDKNEKSSKLATAMTTLEMQQESTFVGWDFVDIWDISTSVPFLVFTFDADYDLVYGLLDISIPPRIEGHYTYSVAFGAFIGRYLTDVLFPIYTVFIDDFAFYNNKLTKIVTSENLSYIGKCAFGGNDITTVDISAAVNHVCAHAFHKQFITDITIGDNVSVKESSMGVYGVGFFMEYEDNYKSAGRYQYIEGEWARTE